MCQPEKITVPVDLHFGELDTMKGFSGVYVCMKGFFGVYVLRNALRGYGRTEEIT